MKKTCLELDMMLDKKIPVLDHGYVVLLDYMGNDEAICEAARISYGDGTKKVNDDRNLIRYLLKNNHSSPFEQCEIKFGIKMPIYIMRQWVRHRTSNLNEVSGRYSIIKDEMQLTPVNCWRKQSKSNKQGSEGFIASEVGKDISQAEESLLRQAMSEYRARLASGVAREQARKDLPLSTYTEIFWKIDLRNLLHFLRLRLDPHAQLEIRLYAEVLANIVRAWVPFTWSAFVDYNLESMDLSKQEVTIISNLSNKTFSSETIRNICNKDGLLVSKREIEELEKKLTLLGYEKILDLPEKSGNQISIQW